MTDYTIIIPAFNEGTAIKKVLEDLGKPEGCKEIIVIDDGSKDDTAEAARGCGVRVISHPRNKGYGASLKTGIREASTDYVICFDGDGQHSVDDLKKIAARMDQYDMVVGARDAGSQKDWQRLPGKAILRWFAQILTDRKIPDLNSGLRSFRVPVIKKYLHLMPDGFSLSTTSTISFLRMGYSVEYIPISTTRRMGRRSTVKILDDGLKVMMLILNLTVLFNPLRVFMPLSAFFVFLSFFYFIVYWITIRVHVTASMVMLFITGVLIFFLGVVCEQISAIRREMHD